MSRFRINSGLCISSPDNLFKSFFLNYCEFNISSKDFNLIIKTLNKKAIHQICLIRHAIGWDVLCRNRQDVELHSVKRIENDQKGMKNNADNIGKRITQVCD